MSSEAKTFTGNCGWIVLSADSNSKIQAFSDFSGIEKKQVDWNTGVAEVFKSDLTFISPAINGKVVIVSKWILTNDIEFTQDLLRRLSLEFMTSMAFCYWETSGFCSWMRYDNGALTRGLISNYGGYSQDHIPLNYGEPTEVERGFKWDKLYTLNVAEDEDCFIPGNKELLAVSTSWGFNPEESIDLSKVNEPGFLFKFVPPKV